MATLATRMGLPVCLFEICSGRDVEAAVWPRLRWWHCQIDANPQLRRLARAARISEEHQQARNAVEVLHQS